MPEAVIVDAVRTPIGRAFKGSLAQQRPDEMGAYAVDKLLERNPEVKPDSVEDVFCGCGLPQGLQAFNIARIIVLLSGHLPQTVNGVTISRYWHQQLTQRTTQSQTIIERAVRCLRGPVRSSGVKRWSQHDEAADLCSLKVAPLRCQSPRPGPGRAHVDGFGRAGQAAV